MARSQPPVSIIVPTYREAANLEPLITRIVGALDAADMQGEIIVVDDDSNDGTVGKVAELARCCPVRLIVRKKSRGLSAAVLRGFEEARFDRFVVLDADLQHPPEKIPELVRQLEEPGVDMVIASRYIAGASVEEHWPWNRRLASWVATALARPLAPMSDPMSGFLAIRRETWKRARRLSPVGYKIALELYVKCGCRRAVEVPIRFAVRQAGRSKLGVREQGRYLRHLGRLYRFRFPAATLILSLAIVAAAWCIARAIFGGVRPPPASGA